jgi:hypothetical protein
MLTSRHGGLYLSYLLIFVKVKKLHECRSKVDKNCASDWADIFETPVFNVNLFERS